jgi:membrane-associated HD superfamily phosphohydrolase
MLCDGVESATRTMAEPTPRAGSSRSCEHDRQKRLHDGQFDDSELTLREISIIEEALTKSLCAIYHGRISYPSGGKQTRAAEDGAAGQRPPQQHAAGASSK